MNSQWIETLFCISEVSSTGAAHADDQAELALRPHDRREAREVRRRVGEAEDVVGFGDTAPRASAPRGRRCDRRRRRHRAPAPSATIPAARPWRSRAGRRASSRAGSRSSRRRRPHRSAAASCRDRRRSCEMPSRSNSPSHAVSVVSGNAAAAAKPACAACGRRCARRRRGIRCSRRACRCCRRSRPRRPA